jgi:hypothetical protein
VKYAAPVGWDAASYKEPSPDGVDPILQPWGTVKERLFAWDNGAHAFKMEKEVAQKGVAATSTMPIATTPSTPSMPSTPAKGSVEVALATFKKEKGLLAGDKPRFDVPIGVGAGKQGHAALFGRDLVIATDEGFAFVTMQRFAADKDVLKVESADLTGDGHDEVVVHGLVHAKLTNASGEQDVQREVIVVYEAKAQGAGIAIAPVFAAEVARQIGNDRVEAKVTLVAAKGKDAGKIVLGPATAKGWTKATWPFGEETVTADLASLVLPWSSPTSATYAWKNEKFVASP